jgi:pimeloyl-ACP methyl ester carboxylesterase
MLQCPLVEPDESKRHTASIEIRKIDSEFLGSLETPFREMVIEGKLGAVVVQQSVFDRMDLVFSPAHKIANADFLNRIKDEGYSFSFDIYEFSKIYENPSLILTGLQDDSVGYLDAWKVMSQFKRASFVVLDAAGHGLPMEQGEIFTILVKEWIERVTSYETDMNSSKE